MSKYLSSALSHCNPKYKVRSYDAASKKRRVADWKTLNSSSNVEIQEAIVDVRNRTRDLRRNSPYAAKIIQSISSNTIGTGILPSSEDALFLEWFNYWAESINADANGKTNFFRNTENCL